MIVGFTGTRNGMSPAQRERVMQVIQALRPAEVHHGCCIGADEEMHLVMRWYAPMHGHPGPPGLRMRSREGFGRLYPEKDYGARNQDIVDACDVLVAAPAEFGEQPSGGTWQTVRRARRQGKLVLIVYPDGSDGKWERR